MMALPRYRHQTLGDLQHLILDPLIRDRIAIAYPADGEADPTADITWLIDVIAPTKQATGSVVANFRTVVKEGELRLHPVVDQMLDAETLEKLGMKPNGGAVH